MSWRRGSSAAKLHPSRIQAVAASCTRWSRSCGIQRRREINLAEGGGIAYLFGARHVQIVDGQIAVFWAALPHRLVRVDERVRLTWLTVPLARVLGWELPALLTVHLLEGHPVLGSPMDHLQNATAMRRWLADINSGAKESASIALLEIEASLRRLALRLIDGGARVSTPASGTGGGAHPAECIAQLIAERYREPLRVADLAAAVHLHPSYAMSLFRQTFDLTIIEYLTRFRVAAAQRLLAVTDAGVLEIALDCGFGSSSRFHAAFKEACGQSPREYRLTVRLRS